MRGNILFIGLDYEFAKKVANQVAERFDMFFLDVQDLIEYSLIDPQNVKLVCGMDYFEKEETRIALSVKNYENTVINFPYSLFLKENNSKVLKQDSLIIYLKLDKKSLLELNKNKKESNILDLEILTFSELNKIIKSKVNLVVNTDYNVDLCVEKVLETIKNSL